MTASRDREIVSKDTILLSLDGDNRFLRCVAEHKAEQWKETCGKDVLENRFLRLVAEERGQMPTLRLPQAEVSRWDKVPECSDSKPAISVYYSPKATGVSSEITTPTEPKESFEVRFARRQEEARKAREAARKATAQVLPASPLLPTSSRARQDSSLSLQSEESFPSLPSLRSAPTTPKLVSWSSAVRKNLDEGNSVLRKAKPRIHSESFYEEEEWGDSEEIVYDADGFPFVRARAGTK